MQYTYVFMEYISMCNVKLIRISKSQIEAAFEIRHRSLCEMKSELCFLEEKKLIYKFARCDKNVLSNFDKSQMQRLLFEAFCYLKILSLPEIFFVSK